MSFTGQTTPLAPSPMVRRRPSLRALAALAILPFTACQQVIAETDFGIVGKRMSIILQNNHYDRPELDDAMSQRILTSYLDYLDPQHNYFTRDDVALLTRKYGTALDEKLLKGDSIDVALEIYKLFQTRFAARLKQANALLEADEFDFTTDETIERDRSEALRPANEAVARDNWRKIVKADVLTELLRRDQIKRRATEKNKPELAEFDRTPTEKVALRYERLSHTINDVDTEDIASDFLNVVALAHDPHTDYLSVRTMERFRSGMANQLVGIGAQLSSEDDGATKITGIIVGGPADQAGELQLNDRIVAVDPLNEGPEATIDTIFMPLNKVVDLIRGKEDTEVGLVIEPANGSPGETKRLVIQRGKVQLKDEFASAQLFEYSDPVSDQKQRVGIITLPSFYGPLDRADKRCTADVRKLLERLTRENIDGLILDLRGNGGGYLDEVRQMVGLFCDRGPVVQVRERPNKIEVQRSDLRRAIYKGPMIVLIDKRSASAAEIMPAALQDNNRAIILGSSQTFGKGTVQRHINVGDYMPVMADAKRAGFVKPTLQKFYRINGSSTQIEGVKSDIVLPNEFDAFEYGEGYLDFALAHDEIAPAPGYDPLDKRALFLDRLKERSAKRVEASKDFTYTRENIDIAVERREKNSLSLNFDERVKQVEADREREKTRNAERTERFAKIAMRDKARFTIYRLNLDDVDAKQLTEVDLEKDAEEYIRKAESERAELFETPEWPNGIDATKRESLEVMSDLIEFTRTARLAGVLP